MKSSTKKHILYLEDDIESVELVRYTLEAAGMQITAVDSPEDALRLAAEQEFDLFLLDGLLPSGYSFDICPQLRSVAGSVPIVFYTALGFPAEVQQGADAGADAYILKPFMGNLAKTLEEIMRDRKGPASSRPPENPDERRCAAF